MLRRMLARWTGSPDAGMMGSVDDAMTDARVYLTVTGAALAAHVSRQTIYNWMADGLLRPTAKYESHHGWVPLFDPADVARLRDRRKTGT